MAWSTTEKLIQVYHLRLWEGVLQLEKISNKQDINIYFADPGTPSQRGLNEHANGLLRRNGLPKEMDFNPVSQDYISEVALRRNNIPRKSLNYKTPTECFMDHVEQY